MPSTPNVALTTHIMAKKLANIPPIIGIKKHNENIPPTPIAKPLFFLTNKTLSLIESLFLSLA